MMMMIRKQIIEIRKQGKKFQMVGSEASSWLFTRVVKNLNLGLSITNPASGQRGTGFNNLIAPGCKENHFYSLPFGQAEASIH